MSGPITTRVAVSDAPLRVGRARLALLAWLAARHGGGRLVLRLAGETVPEDYRWLGLDADRIVALSDRAARHAAAVEALKQAGRLYPCFESEHELRAKHDLRLRRHRPPIYDRAMLRLTAEQRARAEAGGKRPHWRWRLSETEVSWRDLVAGPQSVKLTAISDPVLIAADGGLAAPLMAAVDDGDDGIDLLVRDADQIEASAIHLDLLAGLGARPGRLSLAHVPKLADSLAGLQLRRLRHDGVEPAALATLLAKPAADAPLDLTALTDCFDLASAASGTRRITLDRLRALNRMALGALPYEAVADRLPAGAGEGFWLAVRGGLDLLSESRHWWDVIGDGFVPPVGDPAAVLHQALADLPPEPWDDATWGRWTGRMADTAPLRLALTGEEAGPDMAALLPLIGRARVARRLCVAV